MTTSVHPSYHSLPVPTLAIRIACGTCLSFLAACAGTSAKRDPLGQSAAHQTATGSTLLSAPKYFDAITTLKAVDQQQAANPDQRGQRATLPIDLQDAGREAQASNQSPESTKEPRTTPQATFTLEQAIAELRSAPPSADGTSALPPPSPSTDQATQNTQAAEISQAAQMESLKAYAAGRAKYIDGKYAESLTDLERAAKLNPVSPTILAQLAEVQAASGRRASAISTYRRAIEQGLSDPRIFAFLGREAIRSGRNQEAVSLLVQSRELSSKTAAEGSTPNQSARPSLTAAVAGSDLARLLASLGYITAARDLLEETLSSLPASAPQSLNPEEAELYRRRSELWLLAGDLSGQLNQPERAARAFLQGAQASGVDQRSLLVRRVYASVKSGRTAQAALLLIEDLRAASGKFEQHHRTALQLVAEHSSIRPTIAKAVTQLSQELTTTATPTQTSILVRAGAALLADDPSQAQLILAQRLLTVPDDQQTFSAFVASFGTDSALRANQVAQLCTSYPHLSDQYAELLVVSGRDLSATLANLESNPSPGAALLHARLLRRLGWPAQAVATLTKAQARPLEPALSLWLIAAKVDAAASMGDWTTALEALNALQGQSNSADPFSNLALAAAFSSVQRFEAAYDLLSSPSLTASVPAMRTTSLWLARAELALLSQRLPQAQEALLAAKDADPFDERPYEALLNLYAPRGPLADESKLAALAKNLRENIPTSHFGQTILARDLLGRNQYASAMEMLLPILEGEAENASILGLFVITAERAHATDPQLTQRALSIIDSRLQSRPDSPTLVMSKARLLAVLDTAPQASEILDTYTSRFPIHDVARLHELIIRNSLNNRELAISKSKLRLQTPPRGIDAGIEYAELLFALDDYTTAARVLKSDIPDSIKLTGEQTARLMSLASQFKAEGLAQASPAQLTAALELFDAIASHASEMPPSMHLTRVLLVCLTESDDPQRIFDTVNQAALKIPDRKDQLLTSVIVTLLERPDVSDCLNFLGVVTNNTDPSADSEDANRFSRTWFQLTGERGDAADFRALVTTIKDPTRIIRVLNTDETESRGSDLTTDTGQRSELAYLLGNIVTYFNRDPALSEAAYRLALEFRPDHPWTLNNLGYSILERHGNLEEADSMITKAYAALHDEPSVIDSFGWLRYKQGRFVEAEAVLKTAVNADDHLANPEQLDHYGDVLWRNDKKQEAIRQWDAALRIASNQLSMMRANLNRNVTQAQIDASPQFQRINAQLAQLDAKLKAATANVPPQVSPTEAEWHAANPKPLPPPSN